MKANSIDPGVNPNEVRHNIDVLISHLDDYATPYLETLFERVNLNTGNSRSFEAKHALEKPRWYFFGSSWFRKARIPLLFQKMIEEPIKVINELTPSIVEAGARNFGLYSGEVDEKEFIKVDATYGQEVLDGLLSGSDPVLERVPSRPGKVRYRNGKQWPTSRELKESIWASLQAHTDLNLEKWYRLQSMLRDKERVIDDTRKFLREVQENATGLGSAASKRMSVAQKMGQFFREIKYWLELRIQAVLIIVSIFTNNPWIILNPTIAFSNFWLIWSIYAYTIPNLISLSRIWAKEEHGLNKRARNSFDALLLRSSSNSGVGSTLASSVQANPAQLPSNNSLSLTQVQKRGGIDFSSTKDRISFKKNGNSFEDDRVSPAFVRKSFRGFDFEVIQYKPVSNPVEFFLGSSGNKTSAWFATKVNGF